MEGFDQEAEALKRMGELIAEVEGKTFTEGELQRIVRESGFYHPALRSSWKPWSTIEGFTTFEELTAARRSTFANLPLSKGR